MVSILIPVYNGENVITACLDSVLSSDFRDYEIIILDDNSTDSSVDRAKKYLTGNVSLLKNDRNLGFVRNVNRGLREAKGDIVVLLNMDTVVESKWLGELVKPFYNGENVGIAGSKIYYIGGATIQHAGAFLDEIARSYHIGRGEVDNGQYDYRKEVEYVCGASIAFRKDALAKIGGFDTGYSPAYYEEIDFAFRLRKRGYKVIYIPESRLEHHECYSINFNNKPFFYYISKNRLRFVLKYFSPKKFISDFIPREIAFFLGNGRKDRMILLKAYFYTLYRMPEIIFTRLKERNRDVN